MEMNFQNNFQLLQSKINSHIDYIKTLGNDVEKIEEVMNKINILYSELEDLAKSEKFLNNN